MGILNWKNECFHCRSAFWAPITPPSFEARWHSSKVDLYCPECVDAWETTLCKLNAHHLVLEVERGEITVQHQGQVLNAREVSVIGHCLHHRLQARLAEHNWKVTPKDWWYLHLNKIAEDLVYKRFTLDQNGRIVFEILPCGDLRTWDQAKSNIGYPDLLELLNIGAVWQIVEAVNTLIHRESRQHQAFLRTVKSRLKYPEAKVRFEALWILLMVDLENNLQIFLAIAKDKREHPRVRGLALEGLKETLDQTETTERLVGPAIKLIEALLYDSEPDVRWWACYVVSHFPIARSCVDLVKLESQLRNLVQDDTPAGLGWSVGREAFNAIGNLEGRDECFDAPTWIPYDPWGSI